MSPHEIKLAIKAEAQRLGFELVGVAPAVSPTGFSAFQSWLDHGYAGEMGYLERRREAYADPQSVLPGVRSIIMLGKNYLTAEPDARELPQESLEEAQADGTSGSSADTVMRARISRYAWGTADYHDVLRRLLRQLGNYVKQLRPQAKTRGVVDTAPLLERDFARLAGLGWFGKNTLLINKRRGSFLFLCALLTDLDLEPDAPHETAHCGTCTRCLEACPTDAFVAPYVLDARKCISYLTIELKGSIPEGLRTGMNDWLFGCDICQDVCPWNRKAATTDTPEFQPREGLCPADACRILQMTAEQFDAEFGQTPLARPGRSGILRNAAIVLGNSGDPLALVALEHGMHDSDPVIREACAWALGQFEQH